MCTDEKKIPDDFQPDPPSDIFHETFAFEINVGTTEKQGSDADGSDDNND